MPQRLEWTLDVNGPLNTIQTATLMMQGDNMANTLTVHVTDKGSAYDLTGYTASAWLERSDGVRVPVDGTVEGNRVDVTLPDSCYRVSGRYIAFVRITNADTGEKRTILRITGMMEGEGNGPVLDEEDVIPSIEDIVAQLKIMEQATASANEAATNANAAATNAINTADAAAANANAVAQTVQDKLDSGELTGKGLQILGYYDTAEDLAAGVSAPEAGDAYGVGTAEPFDIYVWDALHSAWVNNGPIQGPRGETGTQGPQGEPGTDGRNGADARRNLLDNSDFCNPINQRGLSSQSTSGQYFIDRWQVENSGGLGTASIDDDGLTLQSGESDYIGIVQRLPIERVKLLNGKIVTMAYCDTDGNVYAQALTAGAGSTQIGALNIYSTTFADTYAAFYFRLTTADATVKIRWVALYEGEYTADTLPEYIPKGYTAELLECQRYYYAPAGAANMAYAGYTASTTNARITIPTPVPMRITPSIVVETIGNVQVYSGSGSSNATAVTVMQVQGNSVALQITTTGLTAWTPCTMRFNTSVALSADL